MPTALYHRSLAQLGRVACLILACSTPLSLFPPVTAQQAPDTEARLEAVNTALAQLDEWLEETRSQQSREEASLSELQREINALVEEQERNLQELDSLQESLAGLDQRQRELLAETEIQRTAIAEILQAIYLQGGDSRLKMLLNQQNADTARRMLVYFQTLNASHLAQIREWQLTLEQLQHNRDDIEAVRQELQQTNEVLTSQQADLQSARQQRELVIAELEREMAARSSEREELLQDRSNLQALIDEINRIIVDIPAPEELMPFVDNRGSMPWPVSGPLLSSYGERYGGGSLQRQGIIIGAPTDTPVRAVHPGRVVFSDWLRGSGNLLVIDHGSGYVSLYAHNKALVKQQGDWVNRGEAVAISGTDAGTGEPAVYFEIRRQRQTLDPADWLAPPRS